MEHYEEWDVSIPPIPSRSRLYCLKPVGIGTSYVECLSSYVVRLANIHYLQPKRLISQEILPLVRGANQLPLSADNFTSWLKNSTIMNGATIFAHRWIHALEQLTAQSDMRFLTMLTWHDVIHRRGLVRKTKAWCPNCYKEWQAKGQVIYEPLIWCLNSVVNCPQHQRPLSHLCPNADCGKPIPFFADWSRSGYCPHCACFLGLRCITEGNKNHFNEINADWITNCVGELLAIAPSLIANPSIYDLALKISLLLWGKGKPDNEALSKRLGVSASNLAGWEQGLHTMSFDILLKLCHQLQIHPVHLLTNIEDNKKNGSWLVFESSPLNTNMRKVREVLHSKLEDSVPPTSLKYIAEELEYSPGFLQYHFPDLCSAITKKYSSRQKKTQSIERIVSQQELERILANDDLPPPLMEIARRLNCTTSILRRHFPDLCEEILKRRSLSSVKARDKQDMILPTKEAVLSKMPEQYSKIIYPRRRVDDWNQQKKTLEEALSSDEPLSLKAIAKSLGCHCKVLRIRFPELCRLVEEHYKKSFDLVQINQALAKVLTCNITPPSVKEIAKSLGYPEKVLQYYFPELCSEIFKRRLLKFDLDHLRSTLEAVLANGEEPISMSEVGRRLGYSADLLRKHFPELCLAIASKYQKFRYQRKQERVKKLCLAVHEATAAIHNQGERPTSTRVGTMIGNGVHFRIPEVRDAWQQKMKELGYEK